MLKKKIVNYEEVGITHVKVNYRECMKEILSYLT